MSRSPVSARSRLATRDRCRCLPCSQPRCSGDRLQHQGGGAPALLGGLTDIAYGQLAAGLGQGGFGCLDGTSGSSWRSSSARITRREPGPVAVPVDPTAAADRRVGTHPLPRTDALGSRTWSRYIGRTVSENLPTPQSAGSRSLLRDDLGADSSAPGQPRGAFDGEKASECVIRGAIRPTRRQKRESPAA